ncbi:type II toxin-antitoxin system ParD family antitoxin [Alsobacter sp. KACC 23698]|uniref:Type II toxin-antitoxin system ParD family antitoxin n=1 Tax=Alsobacter sp. KACC 23698 TaxID=3149229 RepID=A0AAU7JKN0_9HYPH
MPTLTIPLSPELDRRIRTAVRDGGYDSEGEVLEEALRLWEERQQILDSEDRRLKQAYDEGLASGPGRKIDPTALLAEFKARAR